MEKIGITPEYEPGVCDICKENKQVRAIIDKEKKLMAKVCLECAKGSSLSVGEILKKYGKLRNYGKRGKYRKKSHKKI